VGTADITNIAGIVREHSRERPSEEALNYEGTTITWADLNARSSAVANGLRAAGVGPETRIAGAESGAQA
jgi:acyl-CoA synthetase (AMP-forming)/AMP-acid ligase II